MIVTKIYNKMDILLLKNLLSLWWICSYITVTYFLHFCITVCCYLLDYIDAFRLYLKYVSIGKGKSQSFSMI